ncbi:MAG: hypothetical protein J6Z35_09145 [Lachnospiraceae bacterium]|nr:hypothetical protein [Lachnospiraceae bacterium]
MIVGKEPIRMEKQDCYKKKEESGFRLPWGISLSAKEIIGMILLAVLLTACLGSVLNPLTEAFMPETAVTVQRVDDTEGKNVTILYEEYEENADEFFLQLKKANEESGNPWEYVQGEPGKSWTMLVDTPDCGALTIGTRATPRKYLTLLCNRAGGVVEVISSYGAVTVDTYRDQDESEIQRVYLFEHSRRIYMLKIAAYGIAFAVVLALMTVLFLLFKYRITVPGWLLKPIGLLDFLLCGLILFGTAVALYKIGIPNYLQVGDETAYWQTTLLHEGRLDLDYLSGLFAPRGYWCYIPQTIAQMTGKALSVDAVIIWQLLLAISWSLFVCGIFPGLYKRLSGKEACRLHLLPVMLVLLTTWRQLLTSVLMDAFGMIAFFAFLYYMESIYEDSGWRKAGLLAGFFASVACSFRPANMIGVAGIFLFEVFSRREKKNDYKKLTESLAIGILAFVIGCVPQFAINYNRGHVGLLPYDHEGAWLGSSVTEWSSDYAMSHGNIAYPLLATDDQMLTMKNKLYNNDSSLTMEQLFDVYMYSPVETMMLIVKKLLIGFDQKTNIAHPGDGAVPWRETQGMLFSLWNYFILFSGVFVLLKSERVTKREKWIAGLVIGLLVLPETFMKIEWRYIMAGYFMIYYFFTFAFVGPLVQERREREWLFEKTDYLPGLAVFMFAYLTMSFMFLA